MNQVSVLAPRRKAFSFSSRALLLLLPASLLFIALLAIPMLMMGELSLYSFDITTSTTLPARSLHNYALVLVDPYYQTIFLRTFGLALAVTVGAVVLGVPEAYIIYRMRPRWRTCFLILTLAPLLISAVVRTLGWSILLSQNGIIGSVLVWLGLMDSNAQLLFSFWAVVVVLIHALVPLVILSVWTSLQGIDPQSCDAALSLGAGQLAVWRRIVLPQVLPGVLSGSLMTFALSASAFATPALIGGRRLKVAATAAYDEFLNTLNWPMGATIAVLLLLINLLVIGVYGKLVERRIQKRLGR
ncbi:ABC transporter permease [Pseudomonas syringae]|uniref:ABC transporter permease n=1 Tax=Pseudomonas syringae TaxID=317 RepID=UPI0009B50CEE|nr:ABC transporter permease [Pseudomonas syringae]